LAQYPLRDEKTVRVNMPSGIQPHYRITFTQSQIKDGVETSERIRIHVNPKTGDIFSDSHQFEMASYLYHLHYDLGLSKSGRYFIGFITLFLFFAVLSGIFIQAKKMMRNFFTYRTKKKRTQMLDIHNVVGVISLPFTLMYAITGLMFNLAIIYQIAVVVLLYQGDQDALLKDIGDGAVIFVAEEASGVAYDMASLDSLMLKTEKEYGPISSLRVHNYADSNAAFEFEGKVPDKFVQRYSVTYKARDSSILNQRGIDKTNVLINGLLVRTALHYGNFAHVDLRILYFFLAMAVAAMIVVGNLLWVNKRALQANTSSRVNYFVGRSTVGSCLGFIVATAAIIFSERVMPIGVENRSSLVIYAFWFTFLVVNFLVFFAKEIKFFIAAALLVMAGVLVSTVVLDWVLFAPQLKMLWQTGSKVVINVEIGLLLVALIGGIISAALLKKTDPLDC